MTDEQAKDHFFIAGMLVVEISEGVDAGQIDDQCFLAERALSQISCYIMTVEIGRAHV